MAVYVNNIAINAGARFSQDLYLDNADGTSLNLVGYAASAYIRKHAESSTKTAEFDVGIVDANNGRIRLSIASTITADIKPGRYVYDVLLRDSSNVKSIVVEGTVLARENSSANCIFLNTYYEKEFGAILTDGQILRAGSGITSTTIDDITDYGVLILGHMNSCGTMSGLVSNLSQASYLGKITSYLNNGGVVWFRHEWGTSCGNQATSNQVLALLGTSIRVNNTYNDTLTATRVLSNGFFPSTIAHNRTNSLNLSAGGTAIYQINSSFITVAYERVNNGIIIVNADVDGAFEAPSMTLYNAFRDLVLTG